MVERLEFGRALAPTFVFPRPSLLGAQVDDALGACAVFVTLRARLLESQDLEVDVEMLNEQVQGVALGLDRVRRLLVLLHAGVEAAPGLTERLQTALDVARREGAILVQALAEFRGIAAASSGHDGARRVSIATLRDRIRTAQTSLTPVDDAIRSTVHDLERRVSEKDIRSPRSAFSASIAPVVPAPIASPTKDAAPASSSGAAVHAHASFQVLLDRVRQQMLRMRVGSSMRRQFERLDRDGSGTLEPEELQLALKACWLDLSAEEVMAIFQAMDRDNSGRISSQEFLDFLQGKYRRTWIVVHAPPPSEGPPAPHATPVAPARPMSAATAFLLAPPPAPGAARATPASLPSPTAAGSARGATELAIRTIRQVVRSPSIAYRNPAALLASAEAAGDATISPVTAHPSSASATSSTSLASSPPRTAPATAGSPSRSRARSVSPSRGVARGSSGAEAGAGAPPDLRLRKLRKLLLASHLHTPDLRTQFERFDRTGGQTLELREFRSALRGCHVDLSIEDATLVFQDVDHARTGTVTLEEFVLWLRGKRAPRSRSVEPAPGSPSHRGGGGSGGGLRSPRWASTLPSSPTLARVIDGGRPGEEPQIITAVRRRLNRLVGGSLLRRNFQFLVDDGGDGTMDEDQFRRALRQCWLDLTPREFALVFDAIDVDGDKRITWKEFNNWLCRKGVFRVESSAAALEPRSQGSFGDSTWAAASSVGVEVGMATTHTSPLRPLTAFPTSTPASSSPVSGPAGSALAMHVVTTRGAPSLRPAFPSPRGATSYARPTTAPPASTLLVASPTAAAPKPDPLHAPPLPPTPPDPDTALRFTAFAASTPLSPAASATAAPLPAPSPVLQSPEMERQANINRLVEAIVRRIDSTITFADG